MFSHPYWTFALKLLRSICPFYQPIYFLEHLVVRTLCFGGLYINSLSHEELAKIFFSHCVATASHHASLTAHLSILDYSWKLLNLTTSSQNILVSECLHMLISFMDSGRPQQYKQIILIYKCMQVCAVCVCACLYVAYMCWQKCGGQRSISSLIP